MEEWRDIPDYEGLYQVSNLGRVRGLERWVKRIDGVFNHIMPKIIKQHKNNTSNYIVVKLKKESKSKTYLVHRLVAAAFIPNPLNLPQVNHKNEDKFDNRVENLEWCTAKENTNYGTGKERGGLARRNRKDLSKPVAQYTKDGQLIALFPSSVEAYRQTGISFQAIWGVMNGRGKTAGGYIWKYAS